MDKDKDQMKVHPPQFEGVKVGHILALTFLVKVDDIDPKEDILHVSGLNAASPARFDIKGKSLVAASNSADQYTEEVTVTSTRASDILINAGNKMFTVYFIKNDGEPRKLRGRFIAADTRGYSNVEDLDVPTTNRTPEERWRKVDNRTIEWIIIGGVKYNVKK